jgi:hypothetical protein
MAEACGMCGSDAYQTSENMKGRNNLGVMTLDRNVIMKHGIKKQGLKF